MGELQQSGVHRAARELIAAAHKFLHPDAEGDAPKVLDPFAGGGAIPLEALRLGCETHAIDINPVAHLIELCTLVYPQKYGQPDSRPVPNYINRLIAHNEAKKRAKGEQSLFDEGGAVSVSDSGEIVPGVEITKEEYCKNPLAADVKYWGHRVRLAVEAAIGKFYPDEPDGSVPVAYIWARIVKCPNPTCGATIPLLRQLCLCKAPRRTVALRLTPDNAEGRCNFDVVEGREIDFDMTEGTIQRGNAICPFCQQTASVQYMRQECRAGRMRQQLLSIISTKQGSVGKRYRPATPADEAIFFAAQEKMQQLREELGPEVVPNEPLPPVGTLGFRVNNYGLVEWGNLFNPRQLLALVSLVRAVQEAIAQLGKSVDDEYAVAVGSFPRLGCQPLCGFQLKSVRF